MGYTAEAGAFDWNAGRGYQTPSARPDGAPPGQMGFDPSDPAIMNGVEPVQTAPDVDLTSARMDAPAPAVAQPTQVQVHPAIMQFLMEFLESGGLNSYVNLANSKAAFMGHELTLSENSRLTIKRVLAMEVHQALQQEQQRVLSEVQLAIMQGPVDGADISDMCEVQVTQGEVGAVEQGAEVRGVRQPDADNGPADVPNVPGRKARPPRARAAA